MLLEVEHLRVAFRMEGKLSVPVRDVSFTVPETAEVDCRSHPVRSNAHALLAFRAFHECHGAAVARDRQNLTRVDRSRRVAPGDYRRRDGDQ